MGLRYIMIDNTIDTRVEELENEIQFLKDSLKTVGSVAEMLIHRVFQDILQQSQATNEYVENIANKLYDLNDLFGESRDQMVITNKRE